MASRATIAVVIVIVLVGAAAVGVYSLSNQPAGGSTTSSSSSMQSSSTSTSVSSSTGPTPKYGGAMVIPLPGDPSNLNTALYGGTINQMVGTAIFDGLVTTDSSLNPVPDLATSWTVSSDSLTYTFHLVNNASWQDGVKFTSHDVAFTINDMITPYNPQVGGIFKSILTSVDTPDNYTVVLHLKKAYAPLMLTLDSITAPILPEHLYAGTSILNNTHNNAPIGTGPFKFVEWVKGDHLTLVKNPDYFHKSRPYLDKVIFQISPDASSRLLAFQKGDINYLNYLTLPASSLAAVKNASNVVVTTQGYAAAAGETYLNLNMQGNYTSKLAVRQAIAYALNKTQIVQLVSGGADKTAIEPIPSQVSWAWNPNVLQYPTDLTKANQLLDQAGYPKQSDGTRFTLNLVYPSTVSSFATAAQVIQQQLGAVGIHVTLVGTDLSGMYSTVYTKKTFDMQVYGFSLGPDPDIGVKRYFISTNINTTPLSNGPLYNNSEVDRLFNDAAVQANQTLRARDYYQIDQILMTDLPTIPISETSTYQAWTSTYTVNTNDARSYVRVAILSWWNLGSSTPGG